MRRNRANLSLVALVSTAVATALVLSGCTGELAPPVTATIETLATPASMTPSSPTATVGTLLAATGELPFAAATEVSDPGGAAVGTVYTSDDGVAWTPHRVTGELDGSFGGTLVGDDELAAYGGTLWTKGTQLSVLFTSRDRETWSRVELPEQLAAQYRIAELAVHDGVIIAIGTDSLGESTGLRIDGTDVTQFALPTVNDGELLSVIDLVPGDDTLLVIARPGTEGENNPAVSYVSDDAGATWSPAAALAPSDSFVVGAIAVDEGFLATGSTPRSAEPGASTVPAAWFSADGISWAAESVPAVSEGPFFFSDVSSVGLGAPTANDGSVAAVAWNDNSAYSGLYRRAAGGGWSFVTESSVNGGNGIGGVAVAVDASSTIAFIGASGYARLAVVQPENGWVDAEVLAVREDIDFVDRIYPGPSVMTLGRNSFTVEADGRWRNQTSYQLAHVSDSAVDIVPWDPERAGRLGGIQLASDAEGGEVVIGANFPPGANAILAEGWFRASAPEDWTPIAGFEGSGATHFVGAGHAGGTWLAWGDYRDTSALSDPSHALVWSSTDGVNWTRATGDFGSGALETQLSDVCELPDGQLVGIGWVEEAGSEFRTAVWMRDGDDETATWQRVDIGALGESYGYGSSCATGEDGVVLNAYFGGRSTLQLSSDGAAWTEVFRAERGIDFGTPVAVSGGYAASGQLVDGNFTSPVVWLSADGRDWKPVTIPSVKPGSTTAVAPSGDDLVVTLSGRIGDPAVLVRDIASLID